MPEKCEYSPVESPKRHAFSRLLLEITLVMVFVMILTYSPGKNNGNKFININSSTPSTGQGSGTASTTIVVSAKGFILNNKLLTREELAGLLANDRQIQPILHIEPGESMQENLRWLLVEAGKTKEIELAL